jgi:hypothetical protein
MTAGLVIGAWTALGHYVQQGNQMKKLLDNLEFLAVLALPVGAVLGWLIS